MANTDKNVSNIKMTLIDYLYNRIAILKDYSGRNKIYESEFFEAFDKVKDFELKESIYYTLKLIACSDQSISKHERNLLETIADRMGDDRRKLKQELEEMIKEVFAI